MRKVLRKRNNIAVAVLLLLLNGIFVSQLMGLSYAPFTWEAYAATYGPGEDPGDPDSCSDGIDNNTNGLTDCADPACFGHMSCANHAPALSLAGLVSLGIVLATAGALILRRSRRTS